MPFKADSAVAPTAPTSGRPSRFRPDVAPTPPPSGSRYANMTREQLLAEQADAEQKGAEAKSSASTWNTVGDVLAVPEFIGSSAMNLANQITSGYAGIGTGLANMLGLTDASPADAVRGVQDATMHAPSTPVARGIGEVLAKPGELLEKGGRKAGDATLDSTGSPMAATVVDTLIQSAPDLIPGGAGYRAAKNRGFVPPDSKPLPKGAQTPAQVARAAGYKPLPSEAGGGRLAQFTERLGGPELRRDFQNENQAVTTKHAKDEIGTEALRKSDFEQARSKANKDYEAIASLGELAPDEGLLTAINSIEGRQGVRPNVEIAQLRDQFGGLLASGKVGADRLVTEVRQLRKEAAAHKAPPALGAKPDPAKVALGDAKLRLADALDDFMERQATASGDAELASNYKAARKQLAKVSSVESASSGGKANIKNFVRQDDKGVPLTGRLGVLEHVGEYFPDSTGSQPSLADGPTELSRSGIFRNTVLRPIARKILLSDWYQNQLGPVASNLEGSLAGDFFATPGPDFPPRTPPQSQLGAGPVEMQPTTGVDAQRVAGRMSGNLELAPEGPTPDLPPAPDRLTAEVPPALRGDIPFTPQLLDIASELGLMPEPTGDVPFRPGQPPVQSNLGLAEDAPVNAPFQRRAGVPDDSLPLDAESPDGPFPYARGGTFMRGDQRPVAGTQRGAAVGTSDGLSIAPDAPQGPYDQLPDVVRSLADELSLMPDYANDGIPFTFSPEVPPVALSLADEPTGGLPFQVSPNSIANDLAGMLMLEPELKALPAPGGTTARLPDGSPVLPQRTPRPISPPQGVPATVRGFRGVGAGRDPLSTEGTLGDALFFTPDKKTAEFYAGTDGTVADQQLQFQNMLEQDTLGLVRDVLGLPAEADMLDIINAARGFGYDGLSYDLKPGREYVQIPRKPPNGPR